jgi:anti-anti-sigma regulatory factor
MPTTLRLEANLDLQATGRLARALASAPDAVVLDGSAVVHVGGLAAQLLLARHRAGSGLILADPSAACRAGLRRLGIDPLALACTPCTLPDPKALPDQ